jgi:hypothetical protein
MKIVVNDANILIDLVKIHLIDAFFQLGYEMHPGCKKATGLLEFAIYIFCILLFFKFTFLKHIIDMTRNNGLAPFVNIVDA